MQSCSWKLKYYQFYFQTFFPTICLSEGRTHLDKASCQREERDAEASWKGSFCRVEVREGAPVTVSGLNPKHFASATFHWPLTLLILVFSSCHCSGGCVSGLSHSWKPEWAHRQGDSQSLPAEVQWREPHGQLLYSGEHHKSQFTG